tara:strand:- start:259 stop:429 length:171 start_codon:yes stop_codon:yes gene_type:complete
MEELLTAQGLSTGYATMPRRILSAFKGGSSKVMHVTLLMNIISIEMIRNLESVLHI